MLRQELAVDDVFKKLVWLWSSSREGGRGRKDGQRRGERERGREKGGREGERDRERKE